MPEFKLRAPDHEGGGEYVIGDPQERALLLARGYRETTDTADGDTSAAADQTGAEKPSRARLKENPTPGVEVPSNVGK